MSFCFTFLFAGLAWYVSPFFSFVVFLPLLFDIKKDATLIVRVKKIFLHLFVLNLVIIYWLLLIYFQKGVLGIVLQTSIMCLPCLVYLFIREKSRVNLFFLASLWVIMELLRSDWLFGWPWLNLSNFFSSSPNYILWIKYTGSIGVSLWILLVNILISKIFTERSVTLKILKDVKLYLVLILILFPVALSALLYNRSEKGIGLAEFYIVHDTKRNSKKLPEVLDSIRSFQNNHPRNASNIISGILFPETFIEEEQWIDGLKDSKLHAQIIAGLKNLNLSFIACGVNISENKGKYKSANYNNRFKFWYDTYNSVLFYTQDDSFQIAYKSKLVPVEEYKPSWLHWWHTESENYSYKEDGNRILRVNGAVSFLSMICYESLYSSAVYEKADSVSAILMFASEGFYPTINAQRDYLNITRLRAVESGKWIIKTARNGISAVINPQGEIIWETNSKFSTIKRVEIPLEKPESGCYTKNHTMIHLLLIFLPIIISLLPRRNY